MKPIVRRRRKNNKKSLIVITESEFIDSITENKKIFGLDEYQSVGFAVLDKNMEGQKSNGWSIVASQDTVIDYVLRQWMDEALVILPREDVFSTSLVKDLAEMGLAVHVEISEYNSLKGYRKQFERMGENQVLTVSMNSINEYDWIAKRILDILGGLVGCLITLILTIFLGPAIFIASPGPIFFKQKRVGRNGKVFNMYKFRSMYMDAEERKKELMAQNRVKDGMMFKLEYDPRIIGCKKKADGTIKKGVGNFIRDWSLDEFPQFFNVLKGDMSLVGTRPPTLDEWNKYELRHRARLAFKPGITGLWQVSGRSNITDFEEIARLDKEYIKNWVAVIGDSTFLHTGVNSLMNMMYNKATGTVIILDNSTTGMTGHQDHAATGKTLQGDPTYAIDIPALCRAIGVKNVVEVNARDIQAVEKAVKEEIAKDEVSVIITKTPCVLLDKSKKPLYQTHTDKCKKCGMCMKPGCPAMTKNADGTISIDDTMCTGCGLCASLCKFDAIELVKEGDR